MDTQEAIDLISELIIEAEAMRHDSKLFATWRRNCRSILNRIFGPDSSHATDPQAVDFICRSLVYAGNNAPHREAFLDGIDSAKRMLQSFIVEIERVGLPSEGKDETPVEAMPTIELICNRFHTVARQMRHRYDGRPTLDVSDEYDAQDLLHALLRLYFDDVRPEEWSPSCAGKSARMDFLLKNEELVIEVKKTRDGLNAKKIGDELIVDTARYRGHAGCKALVCFVYDPENRIENPVGLENDLPQQSGGFVVKVIIAPKD